MVKARNWVFWNMCPVNLPGDRCNLLGGFLCIACGVLEDIRKKVLFGYTKAQGAVSIK
jgi:hypothetical protein